MFCRIIYYLGNFQYPLSWELENENTFRTVIGPGAYNITGMGSDSMRRAYIESTRKGVFGTTSVRVQAITRKEETEQPGPRPLPSEGEAVQNPLPQPDVHVRVCDVTAHRTSTYCQGECFHLRAFEPEPEAVTTARPPRGAILKSWFSPLLKIATNTVRSEYSTTAPSLRVHVFCFGYPTLIKELSRNMSHIWKGSKV